MLGAAKTLFDHGRDELAAALFSNANSYVMYGWQREDVPDPTKEVEPTTPEVGRPEPGRGIEM
ncbi:MAG TPA: hypothetical protein VH092_21880 [Urbifossiella sp.]|jgi:hypothetical protein|nr:hypothetical protein [Urbifossiella sp.]